MAISLFVVLLVWSVPVSVVTRCSLSTNYKTITCYQDHTNVIPSFPNYNGTLSLLAFNGEWIIRNLDKNSLRDISMKQLQMENVGLRHLSCDTFTNIRRELTILNLDDNLLNYFPACSFNNLNYLRELTLSKNFITCIPDHSIPGYLEHLDMSHNQILTISSDMSTDVHNNNLLKTLNIRGNKLQRISNNELQQFTSLENLDGSENQLEYIHPRSFVLSGNHLRVINLSRNQLTTDVWFCLEHLQQVRNLNLSHNQIDHVNDSMLSSMTNLQTFDISYNKVSEVGPAFVKQQTLLLNLLFHHNSITNVAEDMFAVGTRFRPSFTLDLSFNLLVSVNLTILDCWDCRFSVHHNKLTTICLASNQNSTFSLFDISSNDLKTIPPDLPPWTNFKGSHNPFSTASVMDFLTHFPNRTIQSVTLQNTTFLCTITDIPEILIPSDIILDLADNCVPSQFLCHLKSNVSSQVNINLDRNGISTLPHCPLNVSVVKLSLKENHLMYLNESYIIQEMPDLKYLDLAENDMKSVNLSSLSKISHLYVSFNNEQELPLNINVKIENFFQVNRILDFSSSNLSTGTTLNFKFNDFNYWSYIIVDISNNSLIQAIPLNFTSHSARFVDYSTFYFYSSDNYIEFIDTVFDLTSWNQTSFFSSLFVFDFSKNKLKSVSSLIKNCWPHLSFSQSRIVINVTENTLTEFPSCHSQEQLECPGILLGLDFSHNFLHALPHSETCILDKLVMLNVSHNNFTEITKPIANSSNLLYLTMSDNKISTITSNAFTGLPHLTELDLSFNQLTVFPKSAKTLSKLEKLNLARNRILTVPDGGFSLWPSLSIFNFYGNPLVCSCSTAWLRNHTLTTDLGQCSYPPELQGTSATCLEISACDADIIVYSSKENIQACFGNGLVLKSQKQTLQWNMSSDYIHTTSQSQVIVEVFRECKLVANFPVVDKDTWTLSEIIDENPVIVCLTMSDKYWISNITQCLMLDTTGQVQLTSTASNLLQSVDTTQQNKFTSTASNLQSSDTTEQNQITSTASNPLQPSDTTQQNQFTSTASNPLQPSDTTQQNQFTSTAPNLQSLDTTKRVQFTSTAPNLQSLDTTKRVQFTSTASNPLQPSDTTEQNQFTSTAPNLQSLDTTKQNQITSTAPNLLQSVDTTEQNKFTSTAPNRLPPESQTSHSAYIGVIVVLLILLIILVGGLGVYFLHKRRQLSRNRRSLTASNSENRVYEGEASINSIDPFQIHAYESIN